jgi:uncharacterized membrane protein
MKPLFVLLIAFCVSFFAIILISRKYDFALSARIAMSVMLLFTAIAHFSFTKGMMMMIPGFIPFKSGMVYLTGIVEIAAAIGLLVPGLMVWSGWLLIGFFILILPANINAAIKHIDFQKGTFDGNGPNYLWFRVPLQILLIVWTYFCIKQL